VGSVSVVSQAASVGGRSLDARAWIAVGVVALSGFSAGCANRAPETSAVPNQATATFLQLPQVAAAPATSQDYRIGPNDTLSVNVFQVPDLSLQKVKVDASGRILFPLVGSLTAVGKTTSQLADEITTRLSERYLQNPQVTVMVDEAVSQKVTVDGAVTQAGVFELSGRTSLLQAVAMARGPARDANLKRVAVFRTVEGRRMAAVFDLDAIRAGRAEDPEIRGDDIVVVDGSALKGAWREIVGVLPMLPIFSLF
jgi:polysaccharide export outer membrane protein